MFRTTVSKPLALTGFAPADKPANRTPLKRIVSTFLDKLNWGKRTYAVLVLCAAAAIALPAQSFTTLHSFDGTNGENPIAGLVQATDGDLYGTTVGGGTDFGGTVFQITPRGKLTTLYNFCTQTGCSDGDQPNAGLIQATNGDFYGTAYGGGAQGWGAVFRLTPGGTLTTLYSFCAQTGCTDGETSYAGLIQASNGDFYGTTPYGGANSSSDCSDFNPLTGCGTVFKITPNGTLTTLYNFCAQSGCTDGNGPTAGLIQAGNRDFYGTTVGGGAHLSGSVFQIAAQGKLTTLYSFCALSSCADGAFPRAGLIYATNGNLYGTTESGGAYGGGTVFKITSKGRLTTLYSFCPKSGCPDGDYPEAALIQGTDGNFYGTTRYGGANGNYGTVFKITPSGTLTTLYSFCAQSGCVDGAGPYAGLIQATNGDFYGTTLVGGASNEGTVFSLSVGLGPFVETQATSGAVGATVKILGTDLTGATSVSFNGTAAAFTVVSPSLITTTVPPGATSGKVEVVTPSGTLLSNVPFRVLP